jgi:hypothetical protein
VGRTHPDTQLSANNGYNYMSARNLLDKPEDQKEHVVHLPPDWLARVSDVQYELARIKTKSMYSLLRLMKLEMTGSLKCLFPTSSERVG